MSASSVAVPSAAAWFVAAAFVVTLVKLWHVPLDHRSYDKPTWFAWGDTFWGAYRRCLFPSALFLRGCAFALTPSGVIGFLIALSAVAAALALWITIALFNWPKPLVPTAARSQDGLLRVARW